MLRGTKGKLQQNGFSESEDPMTDIIGAIVFLVYGIGLIYLMVKGVYRD